MELAVYIHCVGDQAAAQLFGVTLRAASSWRRMERAPSPQQALKIVELSEGKVDWKGIYAPYARHRRRQSCRRERIESLEN
jgi:DNA-binding transcriptional regulator YdaS (Cro superfamily)